MAIIDRNTVFYEGRLTAAAIGQAVPLTSLRLPGRMEPMPLRISVTEAFSPDEVQSLSIVLQEADSADADAVWSDVPAARWTAEGNELGLGARLGPRFLPRGVRKCWLRLTLTPTAGGEISTGRIFAALLREEDLPYEPALQVK
ncbi:MAG: hypothetical protein Q4F27_06095 [Desulfovibrionaceae bacterium]|nr:hypothetical protein [Desulfovibrionaceae bacterium]